MNADTLALACASSPAMNTSSGPPAARTSRKRVLNALTTLETGHLRDGGVVTDGEPGDAGVEGVGDVNDDLAGQRVPYRRTTGTALSKSTARMMISPVGVAPRSVPNRVDLCSARCC